MALMTAPETHHSKPLIDAQVERRVLPMLLPGVCSVTVAEGEAGLFP